MKIEFSVNDYVHVKLSPYGMRLLENQFNDLNEHTGGRLGTYVPPKVDKDGYTKFQAWDLMARLEKYISIVGEPPFETLIKIEMPDK